MSWEFNPPTNNTGNGLAALAPDSVRTLWEQGVLVAEQSEDFFQEMESASNKAVIRAKTETAKGKGQKITFTNMSGFYDEPHMGDELFDTADDFEEVLIGDFPLVVDWFRHATRFNERMEETMGMRGEIASGFNIELGKWLGRVKTEQLTAMFQLKLNSENVLYAGGKTLNTLKSADTLAWDEVVTMGQFMKPLGGLPANVAKAGSPNPVWSNIVIPTEAGVYSLKMDPDYKTLLGNAGVRGETNHIFAGGTPNLDGHIVNPYNPIDHDGVGAVGSFLNPKAYLGTALTAGSVPTYVTGGGSAANGALTKKMYFKYFPGYAYKFPDSTYSPESGTHYFLIYNTGGTDAGKVGMFSYAHTGNNGNKLTLTGQLLPSGGNVTGIRATTIGNVTDSGAWSGKITLNHDSKSLIIPCNSYGVPIGDTLMLGRMAAMRGYGKYRGYRSQQEHEGGFVTDRFITSVFGQCIREDRAGRMPSVVRLRHAISYPGVVLPVVS